MKESIGSPVLRNIGEKLLIYIKRDLKKFFKESIEIFELEDVLDIREVNKKYGEEIYAVVITDISREGEVDSDKLLKVAKALQREVMKEILEDLKGAMDNYVFSFNRQHNNMREMTRNMFMLSRYMERLREERKEEDNE